MQIYDKNSNPAIVSERSENIFSKQSLIFNKYASLYNGKYKTKKAVNISTNCFLAVWTGPAKCNS